MKRKLFTLAAFLGAATLGFSQTDYKMWETMYLTPDPAKMTELKEGLAKHNKKFHAEDPYKASVWNIFTGKHEGKLLWVMGPCSWTDLDNRPEGKSHDEDWEENVTPYIKGASGLQYWRLEEKLSYQPEDAPGGKVMWTWFKIKPFEGYRFKEMLKKVKQVYEEKDYPNSLGVYYAEISTAGGYDVVLEWMFDHYAFFDRDMKFRKDYEEIHGDGSWSFFMREYEEVVEGTWDELAEFAPEMSAE